MEDPMGWLLIFGIAIFMFIILPIGIVVFIFVKDAQYRKKNLNQKANELETEKKDNP